MRTNIRLDLRGQKQIPLHCHPPIRTRSPRGLPLQSHPVRTHSGIHPWSILPPLRLHLCASLDLNLNLRTQSTPSPSLRDRTARITAHVV